VRRVGLDEQAASKELTGGAPRKGCAAQLSLLLRAVRIVVARELEQEPMQGLAALGVEGG